MTAARGPTPTPTPTPRPNSGRLLDHLFRHHYGRLVASLTRVFGSRHLDLVEDVVGDALLKALKTWPFAGIPDEPEAWLSAVAKNLGLDAMRRHRLAAAKIAELEAWTTATAPSATLPHEIGDDTLRMMFTCCHPALTPTSRVALTLKTLGGFGTSEIAAALLAREATIAQRLTRAKDQLRAADVAFELPGDTELLDRVSSVLDVLYLMFNEGYRAHRGDELVRVDLVEEAVRLARALLDAQPLAAARPRVHALLALMSFCAARLPARVDGAGEVLTLAEQDRTSWDRTALAAGFHHFERSIGGDALTAFHVEAAIASCHAAAATYEATDWPTILTRYDQLVGLRDSPVVRLNRAVAIAKVHGPDAAIRALDDAGTATSLARYNLLHATRAQLLWEIGDRDAAVRAYEAALALPCTDPERSFLERRRDACADGADPATPPTAGRS